MELLPKQTGIREYTRKGQEAENWSYTRLVAWGRVAGGQMEKQLTLSDMRVEMERPISW